MLPKAPGAVASKRRCVVLPGVLKNVFGEKEMPTQEELDQAKILDMMTEEQPIHGSGSDAVMAKEAVATKLVRLWSQHANQETRMDELAKEQGGEKLPPPVVCPSCFAKADKPHRDKCSIVKPVEQVVVYAADLPARTTTCNICFARYDKPHRPQCAYFGRP